MMSNSVNHKIKVFRRRAALILTCRRGVGLASYWMIIWGIATLVLRMTTNLPRPIFTFGGAALIPIALVAIWDGWRKRPSEESVRALLDSYNEQGGLVMAAATVDMRQWENSINSIDLPVLRWRARRSAMILGWAALFAGGSFAIPVNRYSPAGPGHLNVEHVSRELEEKIQVLEEEDVLAPDQADDIAEDVATIQEEASGKDPAKTWEALDHLQQRLEKIAENKAQSDIELSEQLVKDHALAGALQTRTRFMLSST